MDTCQKKSYEYEMMVVIVMTFENSDNETKSSIPTHYTPFTFSRQKVGSS